MQITGMGIEGKAMEYDFEERLRTEVHMYLFRWSFRMFS